MKKQTISAVETFQGIMTLEITSAATVFLYRVYGSLWVVTWPIIVLVLMGLVIFNYLMFKDICRTYRQLKEVRARRRRMREIERNITKALQKEIENRRNQ